ncbi:hypothetical protein OHB44_10260 [Micromonospora sp. NBC_00821]|uniref:hypothetical protein n=1 Tax=Micromonospora sp. NBC_00821 TaxID=2975977 RepID=UPI002ED15755|nr:hypothetical protein OHB44_10260 [Micromonospora sp. NBC_00821]
MIGDLFGEPEVVAAHRPVGLLVGQVMAVPVEPMSSVIAKPAFEAVGQAGLASVAVTIHRAGLRIGKQRLILGQVPVPYRDRSLARSTLAR